MENDEILEYKCPCCGGSLSFNASSQKIKCPYCDTEIEAEAFRHLDEEPSGEEQAEWGAGGSEWSEEEKQDLSVFVCDSCGGELITEETTASSFCPYCGSPVIVKGRLSGGLRPDFIIPFKLEKEKVNECFRSFVKGKILLPKAFRKECETEEIKGLYVPFWVYDADVAGKIKYRATSVRSWSDSRYHYTETSHYAVYRSGDVSFEHIPVDGSKKMPDELMESIEPYDFGAAVSFQSAYLSGFYSDKYDVTQAETLPRVNERIGQGTDEAFRSTIRPYNTLDVESSSFKLNRSEVHYTLYPVWTMQKRWRDKTYTYAINGQTGKMAGDLPKSNGILALWMCLLFLVGGLLGFGIGFLMEESLETQILLSVIVGAIAAALTAFFLLKQIKTVNKQIGAASYCIKDSLKIRESRDTFLYRNVTRVRNASSSDENDRGR